MVAKKGRTLLIEVHSHDGAAAPPSAALHAELRGAAERSGAATGPGAIHARHYSREARLCTIRTSVSASRAVRTAIGTIRYVGQWPVRLTVVRTFGSERLARRELASRLEAAQRRLEDPEAQKPLRELLAALAELQKA